MSCPSVAFRDVAFGAVDVGERAPYGLAMVDADGIFEWINEAGAQLLTVPVTQIRGNPSPFQATSTPMPPTTNLYQDDSEWTTTWDRPSGQTRELAYRTTPIPGRKGTFLVAFRDATDETHRQRRVGAIARSAAKLASRGSLTATLDALAEEVLEADAVAAVQIMSFDDNTNRLRIMGSAGFQHWPDFFDRLLECKQRGAALMMLESLHTCEPVVVADRWAAVHSDPAWHPLHRYLSELRWNSFASVPLLIRNRAAGILNVFFAPGQVVTARTLEFLVAMAEQAAIAVDYLALLQRERDVVRRQERQRLARDLHDSIVQQAFSIAMQAKTLDVLAQREESVHGASIQRVADEIGLLTHAVLSDLRAMVHELRPVPTTDVVGGLARAVRALADSTTNRTGMRISVIAGRSLGEINSVMADDVYRIVSEAVHNAVKHADAGKVSIRLMVRNGLLRGSITDDGRGLPTARPPSSGYGLQTMRERAELWGGTLTVGTKEGAGAVVEFVIPVPPRTSSNDGSSSL
ncbi:ATP-binding protein [Nocardia aobensis]|uniref:ATP-binding protein n=1 Tax=Nocardia aobensis TaxID=257277 RepID=A0ABW6PFF1_9NOCA